MPIGLGRPNGPNFRTGYLRSALGAVDRRRDLQRSIDVLLHGEQEIIDLARLRELISVGIGEVSAECRQTVWALLLGVLPAARPLWSFVSTQLDHRYLDLSEAADVLLTEETECLCSVDRMGRALMVANDVERLDKLIPIHEGVMEIFASVFPDAEAYAFFMYCSYIRSTYQTYANLSDLVFGFCELIDIDFQKVLEQKKAELGPVVQLWIDSSFVSAKLFGSLLPIWERIVLLQSCQFIISICLALLSCAREAIMHSSGKIVSISAIVESSIRDRPVEVVYSKGLELDATLSRRISRDPAKHRIESNLVPLR